MKVANPSFGQRASVPKRWFTKRVGAEGSPWNDFAISGTPADGFTIHYDGDYPYFMLLYDGTDGKKHETEMGTHISTKYELEINISADALDRVAATDWASYDSTESDAILTASYQPSRLEGGYNAIPEEFRLDAEVSAGFTIQADAD